jgi:hypothetical protein
MQKFLRAGFSQFEQEPIRKRSWILGIILYGLAGMLATVFIEKGNARAKNETYSELLISIDRKQIIYWWKDDCVIELKLVSYSILEGVSVLHKLLQIFKLDNYKNEFKIEAYRDRVCLWSFVSCQLFE